AAGLSGSSGQAGQPSGGAAGSAGQGGAGSGGDPLASTALVDAITAGFGHSCVVLSSGAVKCWGQNDRGQLGLGDTISRGDKTGQMGDALPAVDLGAGIEATAVAAGFWHTCALLEGGKARCWGENIYGTLGTGDNVSHGAKPGEMGDALPFVDLGTGATIKALSAGREFTCALLDGGKVKCWGNNEMGQLGQGDTVTRGSKPGEMGDALPAVDLGAGAVAVAISSQSFHTCALLADGRVKCWGWVLNTQTPSDALSVLGDEPGEMGDALLPVDLGTDAEASAIGASYMGACAVLDGGALKCWGVNDEEQQGSCGADLSDPGIGDEPDEMGDALSPVALGAGASVVSLSSFLSHTCAVLEGGAVKCWGFNNLGSLGIESAGNRVGCPLDEMGDNLPAVALGNGEQVRELAVGTSTCALLVSGKVKCWGANLYGELGLGDQKARGDNPGEMGDALPYVPLGSAP
ncbi:MAG: hypothetical protein EOO72_08795, partial [Myxococcaceae bacterium]